MARSTAPQGLRRFLQFGLRSLLGLVRLVACGLWAYRSAVVPNEQHRRFLAAAEKTNVRVKVQRWRSGERFEWTSDAQLGYFDRIVEVDFSRQIVLFFGSPATDEMAAMLSGLNGLEVLDLSRTPVSDSAVAALNLPQLRRLSLVGCPRVEVLHLSRLPRLEEFDASASVLRAVRFENTAQLRTVNLRRTYITHETLSALAPLPIRELNIAHTPVIGEGLRWLPASLEILAVDSTVVDEPGRVHLSRLPNLKQVDLSQRRTEQDWHRAASFRQELREGIAVSFDDRPDSPDRVFLGWRNDNTAAGPNP